MKTKLQRIGLGPLLAAVTIALAISILTPADAEAQCNAANRARPDFNGDCFADLAVGSPGETLGIQRGTGLVHVIYGGAGGLSALQTQRFDAWSCTLSQDGAGSGNQSGLGFGSVLATGDFNGDRFDDLAVGMPDYNPPYPLGGMPEAGMVYVIFGAPGGLNLGSVQHFVSTNVGGSNQFGGAVPSLNVNQNTFDRFGHALAAGDFNGDLVDDLAIGTPGEEGWDGVSLIEDAGDVYVLYGRRVGLGRFSRGGYDGRGGGLDAATAQGWSQNGKNFYWHDIQGHPEAGDRFGSALAAGDFNGDGRADLAIGVPGEGGESGAVNVIYGSAGGLHPMVTTPNQLWHQDSPFVEGARAAGERFGFSLAAGDFNNDTRYDLAIGAPRATVAGAQLAGEVNVIYGSPTGLNPAALGLPADQLWTQSGPILDDGLLGGEMFGFALAAGDFDGNGRADLVVGAPFDSPGGVTSAGAVNVIYGSDLGVAFGLTAAGNQYLHQDTANAGLDGTNGPHSQLGRYLTVGRFNAGTLADLAIGVPGETIGAAIGAGAVNVVYGLPGGLIGSGEMWFQSNLGEVSGLDEGFGAR